MKCCGTNWQKSFKRCPQCGKSLDPNDVLKSLLEHCTVTARATINPKAKDKWRRWADALSQIVNGDAAEEESE